MQKNGVFGQALISSETRFDGAVHVKSKQEKNDLLFFTVTIPYLGMNGEKIKRQTRFYYKPGLLDYANTSPSHAKFLKKLYNKSSLNPFGKVLNLKQLEKLAAF